MNIIEFGDELLRTGDLDPVYTAIYNTPMDPDTRLKLCLAYWSFYHLGLAAKLAEQPTAKKFWLLYKDAVHNVTKLDGTKPYPRGSERRHFRGQNAQQAYDYLRKHYMTPERATYGLIGSREATTYAAVAAAVQSHVGFGPWIAFKIADMAERVLGIPVDFTDCHLGIYKDPRQGAAIGYLESDRAGAGDRVSYLDKPWEYPISDKQLADTVAGYVEAWRRKGAKAPPSRDRQVNVQEVETIFCKYKSHLKGHYPPGKDSRELLHALTGWGDLADELKKGLENGQA